MVGISGVIQTGMPHSGGPASRVKLRLGDVEIIGSAKRSVTGLAGKDIIYEVRLPLAASVVGSVASHERRDAGAPVSVGALLRSLRLIVCSSIDSRPHFDHSRNSKRLSPRRALINLRRLSKNPQSSAVIVTSEGWCCRRRWLWLFMFSRASSDYERSGGGGSRDGRR